MRSAAAGSITAYLCWLIASRSAPTRLRDWGPRWLAHVLTWPLPALIRCLGVDASFRLDGVDAEELAALAPCVVTVSPHGTAFGHFFLTGPALVAPPLDSLRVLGIAASVVFRIPLLREFLLLMGWRAASEGMVNRLLRTGRSVVVMPGGVAEMVETSHQREALVCPPDLGFVRLAIKHGIPILPIYCFGKTQLFRTHECLMPLRRRIAERIRVGLPLLTGRFGLPLPLPLPGQYCIVVGHPISTGTPTPSPSSEQVRAVFTDWSQELIRLFARHASDHLPPSVVAKGLDIRVRAREGGAAGPRSRL